ncbi:MAG: YqeG family HAD IIIA-type phosphatase [Armatimonadota bacterium]|nr:YqeG family HAD IIIA-type phosphatase [bacterium]
MGEFLDLFCPDLFVENICDIDLCSLKANGFIALILDLDNTLLPWQSSQLPEPSRAWVEQAKDLGMRVCIVSNTHYPTRLSKISNELGIFSLPRALKPRPVGFQKALKMMDCKPEHAVVVGDQLLTDILGGNWACIYTILVKPMHPREFIGTKISRIVERYIMSQLRKNGRLGTNYGPSKSEKRDTK